MMNKTKIDWCDMSWNPVTGCLHGCPYCYARKIATRFGGHMDFAYTDGHPGEDEKQIHDLSDSLIFYNPDPKKSPYPFGFAPTFHRYRLGEPMLKTKPRNIFVCSMADLFGEWVPDEWITSVFAACAAAPQHTYVFLTKNPARYFELDQYELLPRSKNMWFGTSATDNISFMDKGYDLYEATGGEEESHANRFMSIEPLLGKIDIKSLINVNYLNWVIIGAESGNRKEKVIPQRSWIESIVNECRTAGVPIFMKSSLTEIWGAPLIQQFPWEAKP